MKRDLPKHVYWKKGEIYFQKRGLPTKKITAEPDTPEFFQQISDAMRGHRRLTGPRNFKRLVDSYYRSSAYTTLAPRTARDYEKYLTFFVDRMGKIDPVVMRRREIIKMRDTNADRPYFANYAVKVMRILMEHAIDVGWRDDNPAKGVSLIKTDPEPREPWPPELIDAYRAHALLGTRERLVMELCLGTGQRIGDVLKMREEQLVDNEIHLRQSKTRKRLIVPLLPALEEALQAMPNRGGWLLWNQHRTGPWSYRGASDAVRKIRTKIGALDFDIHSWRYNAACELLEAKCTDELISSVTGQTPSMVQHYTASIRQKRNARLAQKMRREHLQNVERSVESDDPNTR
ncbi:MAG: tyrosine-type recombinase/integrase [Pseudomonadota bacterium]